MLIVNLSILGQQQTQTNKCFNETEIDSLYSKFLHYNYLLKENIVLKTALDECNKVKAEQSNQISILKHNEQNYKLLDENYNKIQDNLYKIINDKDILIKEQKKKTLKAYFKGGVIGVSLAVIGFLII